ncbi:MAG: hypothetical protein QM774_11805 [Gordonia sp. (in: high G+C Gram-positive bacteria)]|uniref:hypothetical protein n=1 Tax=Gordonia sp. (in: high G+C Gram-positive bacteria) TaxID=84139 RepID=UPI0039E52279
MTAPQTATPALQRPAIRLAAFAAGLAVIFAAAFGIGRALGPWDVESPAPHQGHATMQHH